MKAIVIRGKNASVERDHPVPKLRDDYVLVKTVAIALNPTDWKSIAGGGAPPGSISGCDYAGIVEEVGNAVTKPWKKGDRIFGCAAGANPSNADDGVFAEYAMVKGDVQMRIPPNMSFEEAATLPLGAATCGQGLYQKVLKLNLPSNPVTDDTPVLIYGGSTATGALGIQYAKLSGYKVITTCSPRNNDYVKKLGASAVFDYNEKDVGSKIREYTNNKLKLVWDTVGAEQSAKICTDALSSESGCKYGTIIPVKSPRDDVEAVLTLMYTIFGEEFQRGGRTFPASSEDFEFAKMFMDLTEKLLAEGKMKTHTERVGKEGLEGALKGMEEMKEGKVSGEKLVYKVDETP